MRRTVLPHRAKIADSPAAQRPPEMTCSPAFLAQAISYLANWRLMALSAQKGYIVPYEYEVYHVRPGENANTS